MIKPVVALSALLFAGGTVAVAAGPARLVGQHETGSSTSTTVSSSETETDQTSASTASAVTSSSSTASGPGNSVAAHTCPKPSDQPHGGGAHHQKAGLGTTATPGEHGACVSAAAHAMSGSGG